MISVSATSVVVLVTQAARVLTSLWWTSFANAASSNARSVTSTTFGIKEGKAWVGPVEDNNDDIYEDTEDMAMQQSGRTLPQQRSEELLYDDFSTLLGNQNLNDLASETQPDDDTRHALVLISLPVDHTWIDADLSDEHHLRIGLLLLFNLVQGQDQEAQVHVSRSQGACSPQSINLFFIFFFECFHNFFSRTTETRR